MYINFQKNDDKRAVLIPEGFPGGFPVVIRKQN